MSNANIPSPMPPEAMLLVAARFKAMSDPLRLSILQLLEQGERKVSDICIAVNASQPNVSKHLKILHESGLLARRQEGNTAWYAIADESVFAICQLVCSSLRERLTQQASAFAKAP